MSKGRPSIIVSKEDLQKQIDLAEENNTFKSMGELAKFIEATEWAKTRLNSANNIQPLRLAVILNKIREWGLTTKTTVGKKIAPKAVTTTVVKMDDFVSSEESVKTVPEKYKKLAIKALTSKVAAIKLNCIQCSGYDRKSVAKCLVKNCALWNHRPFKSSKVSDEEELVELSLD